MGCGSLLCQPTTATCRFAINVLTIQRGRIAAITGFVHVGLFEADPDAVHAFNEGRSRTGTA